MNKPAPAIKLNEMLQRLCLQHAERHLEELISRASKACMSNAELLGLVLDHELSHRPL